MAQCPIKLLEYYWTNCQSHLNNEHYSQCLFENNPSLTGNETNINFANKCQNVLTGNEYEYLINHNYKISNFHLNPKFHKSRELNEKLKIKITNILILTKICKSWHIVARPVYYTSEISDMLHIILEPSLSFIPHI